MNKYIPIVIAGVLSYGASPECQTPTPMSKGKALVLSVKQRIEEAKKTPYNPNIVLKAHDEFFIKMHKGLADYRANQITP